MDSLLLGMNGLKNYGGDVDQISRKFIPADHKSPIVSLYSRRINADQDLDRLGFPFNSPLSERSDSRFDRKD